MRNLAGNLIHCFFHFYFILILLLYDSGCDTPPQGITLPERKIKQTKLSTTRTKGKTQECIKYIYIYNITF